MTTNALLLVLWKYQSGPENLKPGELAAQVGVDVSTIYRWKRGQSPVGLSLTTLLGFLEGKELIARTAAGDGRRPSSFIRADAGAPA